MAFYRSILNGGSKDGGLCIETHFSGKQGMNDRLQKPALDPMGRRKTAQSGMGACRMARGLDRGGKNTDSLRRDVF